ncbi:putative Calcium/calmodulin-dependent protein kinase II [Blattamonas nauphoetae]|uniref:non-specific serine/threonine protein kinase n=1 Tax=Blattamonas nauphoetae TaxID=2049346 RepID=A0ABQ9XMN2_9EUKA|nr:putative Calcium/calmodulin-dependent protein kinase II [Blattamonas nauphoetae]
MGNAPSDINNWVSISVLGGNKYHPTELVENKVNGQVQVWKKIATSSTNTEKLLTREKNILKKLDHPSIVHCLDAFEFNQKYYIALEYCGNGSLENIIEQKRAKSETFTEEQIWLILIQLAFGLNYMHKKQIVHKDLRPAHIYVDRSNNYLLGEFGITRELEEADDPEGKSELTTLYLAPETIKNKTQTFKSDMFSLGVVGYELMYLRNPFLDEDDITGDFTPDNIVEGYSDDLVSTLLKMLDKNPETRLSSQEFLDLPIVKDRSQEYSEKIDKYFRDQDSNDKKTKQIASEDSGPLKMGAQHTVELMELKVVNYTVPTLPDGMVWPVEIDQPDEADKGKPLPAPKQEHLKVALDEIVDASDPDEALEGLKKILLWLPVMSDNSKHFLVDNRIFKHLIRILQMRPEGDNAFFISGIIDLLLSSNDTWIQTAHEQGVTDGLISLVNRAIPLAQMKRCYSICLFRLTHGPFSVTDRMVRHGLMNTLVSVLGQVDPNILADATMGIYNLNHRAAQHSSITSVQHPYKLMMTENGGIAKLWNLFDVSPEDLLRNLSSRAIAYLFRGSRLPDQYKPLVPYLREAASSVNDTTSAKACVCLMCLEEDSLKPTLQAIHETESAYQLKPELTILKRSIDQSWHEMKTRLVDGGLMADLTRHLDTVSTGDTADTIGEILDILCEDNPYAVDKAFEAGLDKAILKAVSLSGTALKRATMLVIYRMTLYSAQQCQQLVDDGAIGILVDVLDKCEIVLTTDIVVTLHNILSSILTQHEEEEDTNLGEDKEGPVQLSPHPLRQEFVDTGAIPKFLRLFEDDFSSYLTLNVAESLGYIQRGQEVTPEFEPVVEYLRNTIALDQYGVSSVACRALRCMDAGAFEVSRENILAANDAQDCLGDLLFASYGMEFVSVEEEKRFGEDDMLKHLFELYQTHATTKLGQVICQLCANIVDESESRITEALENGGLDVCRTFLKLPTDALTLKHVHFLAALTTGSVDQCDQMVDEGMVAPMMPLLNHVDLEVIRQTVTAFYRILLNGLKASRDEEEHPYIDDFEGCDGPKALFDIFESELADDIQLLSACCLAMLEKGRWLASEECDDADEEVMRGKIVPYIRSFMAPKKSELFKVAVSESLVCLGVNVVDECLEELKALALNNDLEAAVKTDRMIGLNQSLGLSISANSDNDKKLLIKKGLFKTLADTLSSPLCQQETSEDICTALESLCKQKAFAKFALGQGVHKTVLAYIKAHEAQVKRIHVRVLFRMTSITSAELAAFTEADPFPILVRLLSHSDTDVVCEALVTLYNCVRLGVELEEDEKGQHAYLEQLKSLGGVKAVADVFNREIDDFSQNASARLITILYRASGLPAEYQRMEDYLE